MSIALLRTTLVAFTVLITSLLASGTSLKAMPIFFDIELTATAGPRAGTVGSGFFSIDDDLLTGAGTENFTPASGLLSFEVNFAGFVFDPMNDFSFPNSPSATFIDGLVTELGFLNGISDPIATFGLFENFEFAFVARGGERISEGFYSVTRRAIAVAEPASLLVFGLGLMAMGGFARRVQRS